MSSEVELEARPRPLSGGLWTLFSWLRRDERGASSDSLSSTGSDRTVASFAFLSPARYHSAAPLPLPPPPPPTDSYKKRVHDRNLRRQHDRDLTLHRKYGLYKSEGPCNYDAFSLPPARRIRCDSGSRWDRERRATSECLQRRLAHVPGKRRAPLPPASPTAAGATASLTRRSRKRPAPQPPIKAVDKSKDNIKSDEIETIIKQIGSNTHRDKPIVNNNDVTMDCKSEKYSKKEDIKNTKDTKLKSEKSFLKQIFDGKKRSSMIDTTSVKVLPSISELDKQAAEIIENSKALEHNNNIEKGVGLNFDSRRSNRGDSWFCVGCLRKYDSSILTCSHCIFNKSNKATERTNDLRDTMSKASNSYTQTETEIPNTGTHSKNLGFEEKQKLKEMLKEMKDSLPKRPKHDMKNKTEKKTIVPSKVIDKTPYSIETPTLRVGSAEQCAKKTYLECQPSSSNIKLKSAPSEAVTVKHHQPVPQSTASAPPTTSTSKNILVQKLAKEKDTITSDKNPIAEVSKVNIQAVPKKTKIKIHTEVIDTFKDKKDLHTPLKISSLLNPVYIPKAMAVDKLPSTKVLVNEPKKVENQKANVPDKANTSVQPTVVPVLHTHISSASSTVQTRVLPASLNIANNYQPDVRKTTNEKNLFLKQDNKTISSGDPKDNVPVTSFPAPKEINVNSSTNVQDQHSKRRELIHQLEQSIAKGDERAAAEAAVKLAQLRLSCSVLSFSSQILSQPSTSSAHSNHNVQATVDIARNEPRKIISPKITDFGPKVLENVSPNLVKEKSPQKSEVSLITGRSSVTASTNTTVTTASTSNVVSPKLTFFSKNKDGDIKPKEIQKENKNDMISIAVLVEDREATRGPVQLHIRRQALVRDLRREAESSLGLATHLQRWIIGRALCANDATPVVSLAGPQFTAPFYLCVVESETKGESAPQTKINETAAKDKKETANKSGNVYTELVQLEQQALVPNAENFECGVCLEEYPPGGGVVLRDCVHIFCRDCLSDVVRHCEEPDIPCPAMGCRGMLQEREVRALVPPGDYERWLARGLAAAESGTRNSFHCRTKDCKGWALCEPGVRRFPCPVCKRINCVPCQVIHDRETCEQHRAKLKEKAGTSANNNETDDGTRTLLAALISKGEALSCPECSAIITKKWGCDWVKCSACKTEICWVTRGRRWGPAGKGDTSAGCRCGVDGKRCHPSCGYCH